MQNKKYYTRRGAQYIVCNEKAAGAVPPNYMIVYVMDVIIFVRHGQSESNITNTLSSDIDRYPLTEKGVEQVEAFANSIPADIKIDALYASPVRRTSQSAEIIGKRLGMRPITDERLWEWRMGRLNGVTFPSVELLNAAIAEEVGSGYKNGMERWESVRERMESFASSVSGLTLAVTHQGPILSLLGAMDSKYANFSPAFHLANASATAVNFKEMKILCIGSATFPKF